MASLEDETPNANSAGAAIGELDEGVVLLLTPDIDMSSALALSQLLEKKESKRSGKRPYALAFDDEDNPLLRPKFMTFSEACQLPPKAVRDELVKLYFLRFHPFCPAVDEFDFMEVYDQVETDEQLRKKVDLTLFQAMMFVAIGFISSARLRSSPYGSIAEYQSVFFHRASYLYRMRHTSDHIILTQVALMLTYWNPFDGEYRVNNYWVDQAFYHARAIKLYDFEHDTGPMSSRHRIIWWCCLTRDRLVACGLRRPWRIQEVKAVWPALKETDFGLEAVFPRFIDAETEKQMINTFIWLCKLTDLMRDIAVFHENNRFDREWSDGQVDEATIMPTLTRVSQFDGLLRNWKAGYQTAYGHLITTPVPERCKMPNYILVVAESTIAGLYLPYIHCPPGSIPIVRRFQKVALQRIKTASHAVALHIRKLHACAKSEEEIMVGIIAWMALPMAVFKILAEIEPASPSKDSPRIEDFKPFLYALATRFHAARALANVIDEATSDIVERSKSQGIVHVDTLVKTPGTSPGASGSSSSSAGITTDVEEAELLNCVAKMVDLRLSTDGSK